MTSRPSATRVATTLLRWTLPAVSALAIAACSAPPTSLRHPPPGVAKPSYSEAVEVRAAGVGTLYVSGLVPEPADPAAPKDSRAYFGDTRAQTEGILRRLKALLERHGYAMRDVVKVNVFLVADAGKNHAADGEGFSAAYDLFFGTAEMPSLPARTRTAAASLTNPSWLVEIDAVAVRPAP